MLASDHHCFYVGSGCPVPTHKAEVLIISPRLEDGFYSCLHFLNVGFSLCRSHGLLIIGLKAPGCRVRNRG